MLRLEKTRSGHLTLTDAKASIHSRYDPVREADRFAAKALQNATPSSIVLLGPGLGYVARSLRRCSPGSRIIGIYYDERVYDLAQERPSPSWHPGLASSLESFLRNSLTDLDGVGLKILNWGPCSRLFPERARRVATAVHQHVRELTGNFVTVNTLGKLWIRNSVLNFLDIDAVFSGRLCRPDLPTIVAASGPSLEDGIPALRESMPFVNLWALPSAVPALTESGISPDLVLMTDPGYYSIRHLDSIKQLGIRLAMPLSAARGAWRITDRISLLCQSNFFEEEIIRRAGISAPRLNAMGTVAASALDILLAATRSKIIFCGLDLCYQDIRSHARPNTSDGLLRLSASRVAPHYSQAFHWAAIRTTNKRGPIRTSAPLDTYAGWFAEAARRSDGRLYRLSPSGQVETPMRSISKTELLALVTVGRQMPDKQPALPDGRYPTAPERARIVAALIRDWLTVVDNEEYNLRLSGTLDVPFSNVAPRHLAYFVDMDGLRQLDQDKRRGLGKATLDRAHALNRSLNSFLADLLEEAESRNRAR